MFVFVQRVQDVLVWTIHKSPQICEYLSYFLVIIQSTDPELNINVIMSLDEMHGLTKVALVVKSLWAGHK